MTQSARQRNTVARTTTQELKEKTRKRKHVRSEIMQVEGNCVFPYRVEEAVQKLGLSDRSKVVACFLLGSRLWGTEHRESDWDLVIVLTQLPTPNDKRFLSVHKGNLDGLLLEKAEYLDRIQKHSFLEVVTCFLKGTPYCLLDKLDATYKPDPSVVFPAVETVVTRDWEMAKKYFDKGMIPRAKKTIVHALRLICISKKLVESGSISDFTLGIEHHYTMQGMFSDEWEAYSSIFHPLIQDSLQQLKAVCEH